MSSSNYYKVWLWDSGASTWREVSRFSGMTMQYRLNQIPTFSAEFYLTDSNLQDLMTAGVPLRVTKQTSSDGTVEKNLLGETINSTATDNGSRQIFVGTLNEPTSDEQALDANNRPIIWRVEADGYAERVKKATVDRSSSISNNAGTVITTYASNTSVSTKNGTIDTGDSINVLHRRENFLSAAIDICKLGDSTDNFMYYLHVDDDDSNRTPRINFLSPTNSFFTTTDPFDTDGAGTRDEDRIIETKSETRRVNTTNEKGRIVNAVQVTFGGRGSGTAETTTSFTTDTTSINTFSRREKTPHAPWIQDSSTAQLFRDTIENMYDGADFDGAYEGIKRVEAELREGELFGSNFKAVPGDIVGVENENNNEILTGRFLGFSYQQSAESVIIQVGLPRADVPEGIAETVRGHSATTRSMNITQTALTTETTPTDLRSSISDTGSQILDFNVGTNSTTTKNVSISGDAQAHGYELVFSIAVDNFYDGGLDITVDFKNGTSVLQSVDMGSIGVINPNTTFELHKSFINAFDSSTSTYDNADVKFNNEHDQTTLNVNSWSLNVFKRPQHNIDLSHDHPM